jgi:hypothetical protein
VSLLTNANILIISFGLTDIRAKAYCGQAKLDFLMAQAEKYAEAHRV